MTRPVGRPKRWKLVVLESPYGADTEAGIERNRVYARACMRDCLSRGESPIASHLLLTQKGVLDDSDLDQRREGIEAGNAWIAVADAVVVYNDLGTSDGMRQGIRFAEACSKQIVWRYLRKRDD